MAENWQRPVAKIRLSVTMFPGGTMMVWCTGYKGQDGGYSPASVRRATGLYDLAQGHDEAYLLSKAYAILERDA
jgi:hypothetical protein